MDWLVAEAESLDANSRLRMGEGHLNTADVLRVVFLLQVSKFKVYMLYVFVRVGLFPLNCKQIF